MENTLRGKVFRSGRSAVALGSGAVLLAGCSFGGLNSMDMPGTVLMRESPSAPEETHPRAR